jgi:hypothetical protein
LLTILDTLGLQIDLHVKKLKNEPVDLLLEATQLRY